MYKLAQGYWENLGNDISSVFTGIKNAATTVGNTLGKAAIGWGRLLDPTSKASLSDRASWLGKGLKSVATDFTPGMAQGVINLPANITKGVSDIGTGVVNSLSGGYFNNAKKNVDEFTSKITNPFKVNFAGNRKGVQQESFNIGQLTGETVVTLGTGAALNAGKQFLKNTPAWKFGTPAKYVPERFRAPVYQKIENIYTNLNSTKKNQMIGDKSMYDVLADSDLLSRYNPFRFKPSENMAYRGLGPEGFAAAKESGKLAPRANSVFDGTKSRKNMLGEDVPQRRELYFGEGISGFSTARSFNPQVGKKYVVEVPRKQLNLQKPDDKFGFGHGKVSLEDVPLSTPGLKIYENSTFRGWKPVDMHKPIPKYAPKNYMYSGIINTFQATPFTNIGKQKDFKSFPFTQIPRF